MRILSCEGKVTSQKLFHPTNASARGFLNELLALDECTGVSLDSISTTLDGPEQHRAWVADALRGATLTGREAPMQLETAKPAKVKAKKAVKRAREEVVVSEEENDDEAELAD